jgi:hypothetical protein
MKKLLALISTQGKSKEQIESELAHVWREKADNLIEVLGLEPDERGYYHTSWGRKTREGLIETIKAVLSEE